MFWFNGDKRGDVYKGGLQIIGNNLFLLYHISVFFYHQNLYTFTLSQYIFIDHSNLYFNMFHSRMSGPPYVKQ